jgi:hypothetical protein
VVHVLSNEQRGTVYVMSRRESGAAHVACDEQNAKEQSGEESGACDEGAMNTMSRTERKQCMR